MIAVQALLLLGVITLGYVLAGRAIHRRSGDVGVLVGLALIYLWTFAGAWVFIVDAALGFPGYHIGSGYYYLMEKMFPFRLDGDYVLALALYASFAAGLLLVLWKWMPPKGSLRRPGVMLIDHGLLLCLGTLFLALSLVLVLPQLKLAMAEDTSFYAAIREHPGRWSSLHDVANELATFCLLFGYTLRLVPKAAGAPFIDSGARWHLLLYPVLVVILCLYFAAIGDRHTLFTMFILSAVYLLQFLGWRAWKRAVLLVGVVVVALIMGYTLRGFSVKEIRSGVVAAPVREPFRLPDIAHVPNKPPEGLARVGNVLLNNELFAAHFSMYGILHTPVHPEPLISFRYLMSAWAPAFLGIPRPPTCYDHYAEAAELTPGQGYTIHHAAGWYLNLAWAGPFAGGLCLGLLWCLGARPWTRRSRPDLALIASMWPALLVAFLPQLVRNGPEAYRTVLLEGFLLPSVLLYFAARAVLLHPQKDIPEA